MGSTGNPNPWDQYDSYRDCSQGVCSVYCPQWCYIIFPPPRSFFLDDEDDSSSSSDFSPLLIALIGILASAFILVTYYTLISKHCHRRRSSSTTTSGAIISSSATDTWQRHNGAPNPNGGGLDETLIESITVYKYRKGDGFVESSDCSVCLSEFQENERLRLLPKCSHAFHVPCIDTWLKSHSNCPLCRAGISVTAAESVAVSDQPIAMESAGIESVSIDSVVVNLDLETGSRSETTVVADGNGGSTPKPPELRGSGGGEHQVNRNSGDVVLIADILREIEEDEESAGVGTSRRVEDGGGEKTPPPSDAAANQAAGGISNFLARSYGRAKNYRLPS
ncbi:hypothetical protein Bca4012_067055 [Brassica carinata]|uniref:RING-type E3 ubiquitin transferase n=1 Tax=Brassica carinata TaxID=52824 RepID=A0A8X7VSC5_BRACI|nr:hypothetical protein Bca52824_019365 [Brassica carinata]